MWSRAISPKFRLGVELRVKSESSASRGSQVAAARLLLYSSTVSLLVALNKCLSAIRLTHRIPSLNLVPRLAVIVTIGDLLKIKTRRGFQKLRVDPGILGGISPGYSKCTLKVALPHNQSGSSHSGRDHLWDTQLVKSKDVPYQI